MKKVEINYFEMWKEYRESIIAEMEKNLRDDINAGYDKYGELIIKQYADIGCMMKDYAEKRKAIEYYLPDEQKEEACYYLLKVSGAID